MVARNIDPALWGPSAWSILHYVSFHSTSPIEELRELFEDLKTLLPCAACRQAYTDHLRLCAFPNHRREVAKWLYEIHDRVNRSIQSPKMIDTPPYPEVQKAWRGHAGTDRANRDSWRFLFLLALAYPSPQESVRRAKYRDALTRWVKELSVTLWHVEPRDTSLHTKTRFTQWLKNKYTAVHGTAPPTTLTTIPRATAQCKHVCKAH